MIKGLFFNKYRSYAFYSIFTVILLVAIDIFFDYIGFISIYNSPYSRYIISYFFIWFLIQPFKNSCRSPLDRIMANLLSIEIVALFSLYYYHPNIAIILIVILLLLIVIIEKMVQPSNGKVFSERLKKARRKAGNRLILYSAFFVLLIGVYCVNVGIFTLILFPYEYTPPVFVTIQPNEDEISLFYDSIDILKNLDKNNWDKISTEEKKNIIKRVIEIESKHMTMPLVNIEFEPMDDSFGTYNNTDKKITIDTDHLENDDIEKILHTALHESRHAYQYHVISLLDWEDEAVLNEYYYLNARIYKENNENYIIYYWFFDNYYDYYEQPIESDANNYADERLNIYRRFVDSQKSTP